MASHILITFKLPEMLLPFATMRDNETRGLSLFYTLYNTRIGYVKNTNFRTLIDAHFYAEQLQGNTFIVRHCPPLSGVVMVVDELVTKVGSVPSPYTGLEAELKASHLR